MLIHGLFMEINDAKRSDMLGIAGIYDQAYDEIVYNPDFGDYIRLKRPDPKRIKQWEKDLYPQIKNGNIIFIVAKEGPKVVGFCFVRKKDIPDSEISHIGTLGIRISEGYRGKGLGTQLVRRALVRSRGKFEIIEVGIMHINTASKALFKKFGFKRWGIAPGYVKRGKRYIDLEHLYLRL